MASSAWERRNERARAEGFRNYYDKRTRQAPGAAKPDTETLRRRRGHAGASDLERTVRSGRVELVNVVQTGTDPPTFDVLVILSDGSQRSYTLRGPAAVARFRGTVGAMGPDAPQIVGSPKSRATLSDDEAAEIEAAAAAEMGEAGDEPYTYDDSTPFD